MVSTVAQPKKCAGRRFERSGPFTAKGYRVLGREAGHGLPPWKPSGHIHGKKGGKVWENDMANKYNRAKAQQAKAIQRYAETVLGLPKNTILSECIAAIARATGCAAVRSAAWAAISAGVAVARVATGPKPIVHKAAPIGKEFYESWEWKEARFAALKRHGRQCQCCGWTPGSSAGNHLVVDHIKPLRTHPQLALDPDNHQVLCNDCNMGKSYKHHDDFR